MPFPQFKSASQTGPYAPRVVPSPATPLVPAMRPPPPPPPPPPPAFPPDPPVPQNLVIKAAAKAPTPPPDAFPSLPAVSLNMSMGPLQASVNFARTEDFLRHGVPLLNQAHEAAVTTLHLQMLQQAHVQQQQLNTHMNTLPNLQFCGSFAPTWGVVTQPGSSVAPPSDAHHAQDGTHPSSAPTSSSVPVPHSAQPPQVPSASLLESLQCMDPHIDTRNYRIFQKFWVLPSIAKHF